MKKLSFYVTALVAGVLASCSNVEDVQTSQSEMEDFVAVVAEGGTRTSLDTNGFGVLWTADGENKDALAIFRQKGKGINTKYVLKTIDSEGKATFKYDNKYSGNALSDDDLDYNYAVYPYSENITMTTDGEVNVTIPATQTYVAGTFDPAAAFMFAADTYTDLEFMNAQALLKIALTKMPGDDNYSITSIKLSANEPLNGAATIQMEDNAPKVTISGEEGKELTLNCTNNGVTVSSLDANNPAVFYLVVTPGTYTNLKLTLTGNNNYSKELVLPSSYTIARNSIVTIQHTCGSDDFTGTIPGLDSTGTNVNP